MKAAAWAYGFCSNIEFDQFQLTLSLMSMNDKSLARICLFSCIMKSIQKSIDEHIKILATKKLKLVKTDEYGDPDYYSWHSELEKYYQNKIQPKLIQIATTESEHDKSFEELFSVSKGDFLSWLLMEHQKISSAIVKNLDYYTDLEISERSEPKPEDTDNTHMSGVEYESYLSNIINSETTWLANQTKASGDQGADIIISKGPIKGVVQTKLYANKVGNKAVQEALASKKFYNADIAFVVSNAGYTKAALELSEKTGVKVLSEKEFLELLK